MRNAVFGHDVLHHVAGRHDACAGRQQRLDLRFALGGSRRDGDEGFAALRQGPSVHEIVLPAYARNDALANRVGANLPREVYLDGRVDRHHARVLADAERVVRPCHILHHEVFAVVHVIVQPARSQRQRGDRYTRHDPFERVVDHAAFEQRQHAVGHRLGMQPEVFVARERGQHGVGDPAHADLQRRPVGDQFGDVVADPAFDVGGGRRGHFDQRVVDLDGRGDAREVDHGVAVGERHGRVDLRDDCPGAFHGRNGQVGRDAERAVALLVGAREVEDCHVDGQRPVAEQPWDFAQEGRGRLSVALGQPAADVIGHEQAVDQERILVFGAAIGGVCPPDGESGVERDIGELGGTVGHGTDEYFGDRGAALNVDAAVRADELYGFGGCRESHRLIGGFARRRLGVFRAARTARGGSVAKRRPGCPAGGCRSM